MRVRSRERRGLVVAEGYRMSLSKVSAFDQVTAAGTPKQDENRPGHHLEKLLADMFTSPSNTF